MTLEVRAEKARKELFARYDRLNALWLEAEERLTKYHIPRPVKHEYCEYLLDEGDPNSGSMWDCLGLQKVKGKWRICHGSYYYIEPGPSNWTPIVDCSAEVRVWAAKHLLGLEEEVVKSAEKFIPKVEDAIQALTSALGQPDQLADLLAERAKLNGRAD
jgi:hypothetical protein